MRFLVAFLLIAAASPLLLHAQTWETLPGAPVTSRHNDVYFVSPDTGWAVSGAAEIHRTNDGGRTWTRQFFQSESHLRSVAFLDARRGFAGNVGLDEFGTKDPNALYETSDGGETWTPVSIFHGRTPTGLCGMFVVNDSVVVAVGRVRGPSIFVKTTDGGRTWTSKDMSAHAAGLIDVYFTHPDTGFAVGLTHVEHEQSSGVVLATTDGGETWEERFTTTRTGEWLWKMSFPTRRTGYASLQRNSRAPIYFLKTTDGGASWEEKLFSNPHYFVQGIGFASESTGWIGGNSTQPPYMTSDGGETWQPVDIGRRLNRFRFLGDSLGYAAGSRIHKFTAPATTSIADERLPATLLLSAFPNPFENVATVGYTLTSQEHVSLEVHDLLGRHVRTLTGGIRYSGAHRLEWDGSDDGGRDVASGVYVIVLKTASATQTQVILRMR